MTHYAYVFEANGIQQYILASGKLKECVGASERLVDLTGEVLDSFCQQFQLSKVVTFSRRAGGAIYAFALDQSPIDTFVSAWPMVVRQFMPGLAFSQSAGCGALEKQAFANARAAMLSDRNHAVAAVPGISPAVALAPRTARPASYKVKGELTDTASRSKSKYSDGKKLIERFCKDRDYHWPIDLHPGGSARLGQNQFHEENCNEFPFQHPGQYLAVIHIDGNSLGQRLRGLDDVAGSPGKANYVECFKNFSSAIEDSTSAAATAATTEVLLPNSDRYIVPARPIVLGGDDLTVIVRADLALGFVAAFLKHFECETAARLELLGLDGMTACAGIAYVKPTYPFHLAHEIAESLCSKAKSYSKQIRSVPSSICFSRTTNSLVDVGAFVHSSLGAYALDEETTLPAIGALLDLIEWVSQANASSRFRALLGLAASEQHNLRSDYERWRYLTLQREDRDDRDSRRSGIACSATLANFDNLLQKVNLASQPAVSESTDFAALSDLLTLIAVKNVTATRRTNVAQTTAAKMETRHA